jgi:hypothetical protein
MLAGLNSSSRSFRFDEVAFFAFFLPIADFVWITGLAEFLRVLPLLP